MCGAYSMRRPNPVLAQAPILRNAARLLQHGATMGQLYIATATFGRTAADRLPEDVEVTYTRYQGWQLWQHCAGERSRLVAGEREADKPLRLDCDGYVLVDTLKRLDG